MFLLRFSIIQHFWAVSNLPQRWPLWVAGLPQTSQVPGPVWLSNPAVLYCTRMVTGDQTLPYAWLTLLNPLTPRGNHDWAEHLLVSPAPACEKVQRSAAAVKSLVQLQKTYINVKVQPFTTSPVGRCPTGHIHTMKQQCIAEQVLLHWQFLSGKMSTQGGMSLSFPYLSGTSPFH